MMRALLTLVLLACVAPAQASEIWSRLWRNADQQGEALLQRGDASSAAKVYADPRRKAYAKLKAGDYAGAAHDLDNLHDSDADYNRGNALAHVGNLQGALDAYDAALKSNPNNQDARHNRDLVAKALKQQPPQQQNAGGNKSQDDDKHEGQQGKGQDSSGQGKQDGQTGKNKSGQQEKSGQADNKSDKGKDSSAQNKSQQQGAEGQKSPDGKSPDGKQAGQGTNGKNEHAKPSPENAVQARQAGAQAPAKDDTEQARRDAAASFAKATTDGKTEGGVGGEAIGGAVSATAPKSEQQIAQKQWLRSIPDDPSGLLRRKFLIEHMMRQQKAQQ